MSAHGGTDPVPLSTLLLRPVTTKVPRTPVVFLVGFTSVPFLCHWTQVVAVRKIRSTEDVHYPDFLFGNLVLINITGAGGRKRPSRCRPETRPSNPHSHLSSSRTVSVSPLHVPHPSLDGAVPLTFSFLPTYTQFTCGSFGTTPNPKGSENLDLNGG